MHETPGRQRLTRWARRSAVLTTATQWHWPVVPGAELLEPAIQSDSGPRSESESSAGSTGVHCACGQADCVVPGAHPHEPGLLAATTDARMIRWWWSTRPDAPVILATGGKAPCALSLPATAGVQALSVLDRRGVRTGPVVATPTRFVLLVQPYELAELGELLYALDHVPSSLRFHGEGGYVALPPALTGSGPVCWERPPMTASGQPTPYLPSTASLLDVLVEASAAAPGGGSRLTY